MAECVLCGVDRWTRERISAALRGDETIKVTLRRPIPVLIVYATAVALEGGDVRFLPDIYGQDARNLRRFAQKAIRLRRGFHGASNFEPHWARQLLWKSRSH